MERGSKRDLGPQVWVGIIGNFRLTHVTRDQRQCGQSLLRTVKPRGPRWADVAFYDKI